MGTLDLNFWPMMVVRVNASPMAGRIGNPEVIFTTMSFLSLRDDNIGMTRIAVRAILFVICISIAFGGAMRTLAISTLPGLRLVGYEAFRALQPVEEAPLHEEVPSESPSPSELPEESPSLAAEQRHAKRFRDSSCASGLRTFSSRVSFLANRTAGSSSEHRLLNGCGAHLRC